MLEKVEKYGARGVMVVPDWPGSEVDSLMQQASKVVELMAVRSMEFASPFWREDNTFRGWSNFGMRVYRIRYLVIYCCSPREYKLQYFRLD